jgi:hypothetical protein
MKLVAALTVAMLALPLPAYAASGLAGTYECTGWNPGTAADAPPDYTGTLTLTDQGDAVTADWYIGKDALHHTLGTGMVTWVGWERVVSFGYDTNSGAGIAVYKVSWDGKTLTGLWGPGTDPIGRELNKRK